MRILDIEKEIWWWKYLPPKKPSVQLRIVRIRESNLFNYFIKLVKIYLTLNNYNIVITHQDSYDTFLIAFLNSIFKKKKCKHFVNEFMTSEKKTEINSIIKYLFLKFCLSSVYCFICSSTKEIEYYKRTLRLKRSIFVFIPLATDPKFFEIDSKLIEEYVISAGRTGRDYATLLKAAEKIPYNFKIVADINNIKKVQIPNNVNVIYNIPLSKLIKLIASAKFVVLPLLDKPISVGQSVLLQAMAMGKAIIATRNAGTLDYLHDNVDSILVPPYNHESLYKALVYLLDNQDEIDRIGNNAKTIAKKKYMIQTRIKRICSLFMECY